MGAILAAFPDQPQHSQTVTLDNAQYVVRLTWRARTASWYFDLYTVDGDPLLLGRRLSAGWAPTVGLQIDGLPDGMLYVRGRDGYARDDLSDDLLLVFYPTSEIAAVAPEEDRFPVVEIA